MELRPQALDRVLGEHGRAGDVGGHEIGGELHAAVRQLERLGEGAHHRRLADSWDPLEQGVTARDQAQQHAAHRFALADDHALDLRLDRVCRLTEAVGIERLGRDRLDRRVRHRAATWSAPRLGAGSCRRPRAAAFVSLRSIELSSNRPSRPPALAPNRPLYRPPIAGRGSKSVAGIRAGVLTLSGSGGRLGGSRGPYGVAR